jgi:hypothetical protein
VSEKHKTLQVFLPKLLAALERDGNSDAVTIMAWKSVMAGAEQPPIESVEHYRAAWIACTAAADILSILDDGSEAAVWLAGLTQRIMEFERAFTLQYGHRPLSPAGPEEIDEPSGNA